MKVNLIYLVILSSLIALGCKINSNTNRIKDFESFVKAIPMIDLPYNTTCESCCESIKLDIDSSFFDKFHLEGLEVVGKLIDNDQFVGVLYAAAADYMVPRISIYDRKGNVISEHNFFGISCGRMLDYYGSTFLEINKQLQFTEIDSTLQFKMDTVKWEILDTLSKDVKIYRYEITKQGRIRKQ
jgi:hypothetical protein